MTAALSRPSLKKRTSASILRRHLAIAIGEHAVSGYDGIAFNTDVVVLSR
jgi:hypothetical protein